jgi:hypothetical protein
MKRLIVVWSGVWSEVKWRSCVECLYYHWFQLCNSYVGYCIVRCLIVLYNCPSGMPVLSLISVMQFVCGLLYCTLSYCFVYLSHCFLCTRFTFCYSFCDCIFSVPFASTLCVLYFPLSCTLFILMYICSFLFVYSLPTTAAGWNPNCS